MNPAQQRGELYHAGAERFVPGAGHIAYQRAGGLSSGHSVGAVGDHYADDLIAIAAEFASTCRFAESAFRHWNLEHYRAFRREIVRAERRRRGLFRNSIVWRFRHSITPSVFARPGRSDAAPQVRQGLRFLGQHDG